MKKLLSILLVAMLVIGMFPATPIVTNAATQTYTKVTSAPTDWSGDYLIVYESGNVAFNGGLATSAIDAAGNYISVSITDGKIEYNATTSAAQFTIAAVSGGYTIQAASGAYMGRTGSSNGMDESDTVAHVNTISLNSDATVTIKSSGGPTMQYYNSGSSSRFRYYKSTQQAICLYKLSDSGSTEPSCEHTNTTEQTDGYAAQCGVPGMTNSVVCDDCGETVTAQTEIPALTHSYVDGTCEHCGEAEPTAPEIPTDGYYKQVTALSDVTAGGQFVIVAANGGTNYAMNLGTSSKLTTTEVTVVGDSIVADDISTLPGWVFVPTSDGVALQTGDVYLGYGTSGTNFASKTSPYTWTVEGSSSFRIKATTGSNRAVGYQISGNQFGGYSTTNSTGYVFDLYLYKLVEGEAEVVNSTLTFKELGTTTKTETAEATKSYTMPAATNAAPEGYTFSGWVEAQLLEETAIAPETVYAAGSSYTVGNDATFYALYTRTEVQSGGSATAYVAKDISEINDGDVVVITMTKDGTIYALPNNGGASAPSASQTATVNGDGHLAANFDVVTWAISKDGDNLVFYVNGDSESWLYCLADSNNGVRVGTGDAKTFVVDAATGYLMNTETTNPRHIGVYLTQDWRCYKAGSDGSVASNIANQTLTFYVKSTITGTVETDYYTTCVHSYASVSETTLACAYCGTEKAAPASVNGTAYETLEQAIATGNIVKLQAPVDEIAYAGNLKLDLNGYSVGSINIAGYELYLIDSKATVEAASGATVGSYSCFVINRDSYSEDGKTHYVLLEDNGVLSLHVLELYVSHVTLRTTTDSSAEKSVEPGLYYKTTMKCDEQLAAAVAAYGTSLTADGNTATTEIATNGMTTEVFTSGSVFGIFKEERTVEENVAHAQTVIYATAYIQLNQQNATHRIMATSSVGFSMKDVLDKIASVELTEAQQKAYEKFTTTWADEIAAMS